MPQPFPVGLALTSAAQTSLGDLVESATISQQMDTFLETCGAYGDADGAEAPVRLAGRQATAVYRELEAQVVRADVELQEWHVRRARANAELSFIKATIKASADQRRRDLVSIILLLAVICIPVVISILVDL